MTREVDLVPDYLVLGLLDSKKPEEDDGRTAEQEHSSIWEHVTVGDIPVIVRSANRRSSLVRRAGNRRPRGI